MPVEYRDIDPNGIYRIGNDGSVWSRMTRRGGKWIVGDTWTRMRPTRIKGGYFRVGLHRLRPRLRYVHGLVLAAFVGPCPPGMMPLHNDGKPGNNCPGNLRYGTAQDNADDCDRHGRRVRGQAHPMSKLTPGQVIEIRRRRVEGEPRKAIAADYKVSAALIYNIDTNKTWTHC